MLPTYYKRLTHSRNNTLFPSNIGADWTGQQMQQQWGNAQPGLASAGQQLETGDILISHSSINTI